MRTLLAATVAVLALQAGPARGANLVVNCGTGSLNAALAGLDKHTPNSVLVLGTCREFVSVRGFDGLTLRGLRASVVQPGPIPSDRPLTSVLEVMSSRDVTVEGLRIQATDAPFGMSVGQGSSDIRLQALTFEGGTYCLSVHSNSQVNATRIVARNPGWAAVGIWDMSALHIERALIERASSQDYRAGFHLGQASLSLHSTTIRDFEEGIRVEPGGKVSIQAISDQPISEPSEVLIESPARRGFVGLRLSGGVVSVLSKLRITTPGQAWGGDTAGVLVEDGGTLVANANLEITGSQGQGLLARNGAHVSLGASRISGGAHGGLVAVNDSNVAVALEFGNPAPAEISGNATDIFCDGRSLITGGASVSGASVVSCAHLLPGSSDPLP